MGCGLPGFLLHHQLPLLAQTHVHWVGNVTQPFHLLSSPSLPTFNLSQHQGLVQWDPCQLFASGGQSTADSASASILPMNIQDWFPLGLTDLKILFPIVFIPYVIPKGNQSWIFTRRTNAVAETPILWPPDAQNKFIGKDPAPGKDWRWEEKGTKEDEMVGWYHWLSGHEFEQAPGVGDGQGSLVCCSSWGCRVRHNWATELK